MLIRDLGERGLLKLIQPYCLPKTIGDDGAIVHPPLGCELVVTTDVLVDGVHFSDRTTSPFDVGWRSVAANLSDLAAMGATPLGITVGLSLPPDLPVVWLEQLYAGMQACLQRYDTGIIGGDLTRSSIITVAITALGAVTADRIIARSTARVGDLIVVTGDHGDSHAGLQLLLDPELGRDISKFTNTADLEQHRQILITAHQRPQPRLDILPLLDALAERLRQRVRASAGESFPISGMDSSDGLADAIEQICRSSGVGAILNRSMLPISPSLSQMFPATTVESALYGGEDFELVLCLPASIALELVDLMGKGAAIVGKITRSPDIILVDDITGSPPIYLAKAAGFQHF
ncbi:thiamine-phosphate kinase [Chamaesiphon sp. VAR_48_metabat_135_sub]|uniref:thiamine-phosphate kinase n=1 Tax=Chamaesiphon sp. VAR_48_metabat_135_sub TaxID=2964699 RepID=UPI00286D1E25|nr:thiamine-phosphate kinase [Chamaesiphon sp. VAR_48_metabat_135_sub]